MDFNFFPLSTKNQDRAAHKAVKRVMAHKEFAQSYHAQPSVDPALVYKTFNDWAAAGKFSRFTRHALRKQLDVRSAGEFRDGISKSVAWLAANLQRHPKYALIVEIDDVGGTQAKSSTWLAGPVVAELRARGVRKPMLVIPYNGWLGNTYIDTAVSLGITAFVHVDDAIYSGSQKAVMMASLQAQLARAKSPPVDVFVAAAYSTRVGLQLVLHDWEKHVPRGQPKLLRVHVYAPREIRKRTMPLLSRLELAARGRRENAFRGGPTMTVLSHKVPNAVSFGPASLSSHLARHIEKPIYKRMQLPFFKPPAAQERRGYF